MFLFLIAISIWISVFSIDNKLQIIACDVGQGDAILIQKNTRQILIDGGPDGNVLYCLGKYMPFFDRTIELVILTHSDKDHVAGVVDVFKNYKIENFLTNDLDNPKFSNQYVEVLKNMVGGGGVQIIHPTINTQIRVGMMYLDIVHPTEDFVANKTNDYSIVAVLNYLNFKAIFVGDVENKVSDNISSNRKIGKVNYIKVNHHGSKNGLSEKLLKVLEPKIAVISVGKNNRYGHPHDEILQMLKTVNAKILRTDQVGDVIVTTDGEKIW